MTSVREKEDLPDPDDHAEVRVMPPLLFALGLALSVSLSLLMPLKIFPDGALVGTVGLIVFFLGLMLMGISVNIFKRYDEDLHPHLPTQTLITTGPYKYSRNPMYVSFVVMYIGAGLLLNTWWIFIALPLLVLALFVLAIRPEETYLMKKFGPKYEWYQKHTRRWI